MFSEVIAFPVNLLRNVSLWDQSIEKYVPSIVFKIYRFVIHYVFVGVGVACESVHLKAYETFEVWEMPSTIKFWHLDIEITLYDYRLFFFVSFLKRVGILR